MPSIRLQNLNENLYGYWIRLSDVTREMITFSPDSKKPLELDGRKLPLEQEQKRK